MTHGKWKCALLLQMFAMLSACSTGSYDFAAKQADAGSLFQGPQADRQALQALTSKPGTYPSLSALLAAPSTQGAWLVGIKPALVDADNSELAVKLPDEGVVRFNLRRSSDVAGMSGWIGDVPSDRKQRFPSPDEVDFDPFNWISLVRDGDQVVGDIHYKGQLYRLEPIGAGQHVLVKVDESRMAPEGDPFPSSDPSSAAPTDKSARSAHSTIRVMFVTTNERRTRSPNYRAELVQALQNANQYLINSRVPITYQLTGFFDPDYNQGAKSQWAMLQEMADTGSSLGRRIAAAREESRADLVSLYNTESSVCGYAFSWSTKERGFHTISCTVALAHELGHNLGGGHGLEGSDPEKSYNHGYRHYSPNFHTLQVTSHGAVPYFSNPRLHYQGVAMGTFQNHDIARQFDEYRHVVENIYPPANPVRVTVFDEVNMRGDSCSFNLDPEARITLIEKVCGASWKFKVWSARVENMGPQKTLYLGNMYARHAYISHTYAGDFNIYGLSALTIELPEGMEMKPHSNGLSRLINQVELH